MKHIQFLPETVERKGEGGLRTKSVFKKSYQNKPLISVITVVFNAEKFLEQTIESVINQTYDNVEYIIIDGASTDGSIEIVKKYEDKIDYWVSEKDKGIYEAMNKGLDLASGEWINFMNAGDSFFDLQVLDDVFTNSNFQNIDIIYGDHKVIYPNKTRISKAGNISDIWKGSQFCHQSAFISLKFHKLHKYNICNKIIADFEFFYTSYKLCARFQHISIIVANYSAGGISDIKRIDSILGRWNLVEKNTPVNLYYIWLILKEMVENRIKKILGK